MNVTGIARCLALTAVLLLYSSACSAVTHYDGHWWLALTQEEQSSYIEGDADCHQFELNKKDANPKSVAERQEFVSGFYWDHRDKRALPVYDVLRIVDQEPLLKQPAKGGEVWNARHTFYDGQWWNLSVPAERLAFIEGYLACYARSVTPHG